MQKLIRFPAMKRADIVARQLEELAKRHHTSVDALRDLWIKDGGDRVTFMRIAKAKAKSEPKAENLRKIAALVGETRDRAFPEDPVAQPPEDAIVVPADPDVAPSWGLKTFREVSPDLQREVEMFIRYANRRAADEAHAVKKTNKNKKSR